MKKALFLHMIFVLSGSCFAGEPFLLPAKSTTGIQTDIQINGPRSVGQCLNDYCDGLTAFLTPSEDAQGYNLELKLKPNFGATISGAVYYNPQDRQPYYNGRDRLFGPIPGALKKNNDEAVGFFAASAGKSSTTYFIPYITGFIKVFIHPMNIDSGGGTYLICISNCAKP